MTVKSMKLTICLQQGNTFSPLLCSSLDMKVMSVSKVIWDSLSLSTNPPIDFLKLHSIPTPSSTPSLNSLLQPSGKGSLTGVVLLAVNHPAMFQLCVTVSI